MSLWNGGMPDVLMTSGSNAGITSRLESNKVPLGVMDSIHLDREPDEIDLTAECRVHIYSDGVIEADGEQGGMFGQQRLEDIIARGYDEAGMAGDVLVDELSAFRGETAQADDITYLELDCNPELMIHEEDLASSSQPNKPSATWTASLDLNHDALRNTDPLPMLLQMVSEIQGLASHRSHLFTILSELYNNALEHGLLGLDSSLKDGADGFTRYYHERERRLQALSEGGLRLELHNHPADNGGSLEIVVRDTGKGFDRYQVPSSKVAGASADKMSGRGLSLVGALCQSLEFFDSGSSVKAVYVWETE
jgi:anti-sigma regulatory factor (Ser/Thr protein kinase)